MTPALSLPMGITRPCFPTKKLKSSTTSRTAFVSASSPKVTVPSTRWSRPPVPGNKNIAEGSKASGTSKEMEIKLTNVARASLEELLIDYRDFLRVRDHAIWEKDSKEVRYARKLGTNLT